ncbi:MAG: epoxyqueuosine reductase [Thermoguttaceae bacterium]
MCQTAKTDELVQSAKSLGFVLAGVAPASSPKTYNDFLQWVDAGCHAGMDFLATRKEARKHPNSILPHVQSLLMLGVTYSTVLGITKDSKDDLQKSKQRFEAEKTNQLESSSTSSNFSSCDTKRRNRPDFPFIGVAEFARGVDYHDWIRERLHILAQKHRELFPNERCRGVVDTAPLLERQFAVDAGLGLIGKNTMLIHPHFGSKIFLAALLSTVKLDCHNNDSANYHFSDRLSLDFCGDCTLCIDACPMQALKPYHLDARRCLSYWTIEHRGQLPPEIQENLTISGQYGCDVCQNVCPYS